MFRPDKAEQYEPSTYKHSQVIFSMSEVQAMPCMLRRDLLIVYGDGIEAYVALKGKAEKLVWKLCCESVMNWR